MPINMILPLQANTLQSEKSIAQIQASLPLKKQLWQQTVAAKIFNQGVVLGKVAGVETGNMFKWSTGVKSGDSDNLEGRAAAYYWRNMFPETGGFRRDKDGEDSGDTGKLYGDPEIFLKRRICLSLYSADVSGRQRCTGAVYHITADGIYYCKSAWGNL